LEQSGVDTSLRQVGVRATERLVSMRDTGMTLGGSALGHHVEGYVEEVDDRVPVGERR
jgi:hypothetical protein